MTSLSWFPAALAGGITLCAAASETRADCAHPGECLCGGGPTTLLEGQLTEDADGALAIEVSAVHGEGDAYASGETVVIDSSYQLGDSEGPAGGDRVLVYVNAAYTEVGLLAIDGDGTIDCHASGPDVTVAQAVSVALSDDCYQQSADLGFTSNCDDTVSSGCSVGRCGDEDPQAPWLLALVVPGWVVRRRLRACRHGESTPGA